MHQKIQEFLEKQEKVRFAQKEKEKAALLMRLNLFEKEYSEEGKESKDYPCEEWDNDNKKFRYYKKVPIEISDEEYEEILKYVKTNTQSTEKETNGVSTILKVIADIIFGVGFIAGIVLGASVNGSDFSFSRALICWTVCFICGMLFIAFAEVIQLLDDIKRK